mgnify:FL=1
MKIDALFTVVASDFPAILAKLEAMKKYAPIPYKVNKYGNKAYLVVTDSANCPGNPIKLVSELLGGQIPARICH